MNPNTNKTRAVVGENAVLQTTSNDPLVGTMLGDHLQILACLGSGGMSVVYKAHDLLLNRTVAVKVLHPHSAVNPQNVLRFRQEAMAASKINHPNVISIYEFNIPENGQPYLVMDYLKGQSLAEFISANGPIEMQRAISLMSIICDGLQRAHDVGVVHRDIKPGNIMLVKDAHGKQTLKIVDFGIAKILTENENGHELTQTGEVFGSPLYMSPEQCFGSQLDARSDLYSLGCVMYEMCTKNPPIKGKSLLETIQLQTNTMPPPAKTYFPGIRYGDIFDLVISKALAKAPEDRFQSATEFKQALLSIVDGATTRDFEQAKRKPDQSKILIAAGVALVLGAVSAVGFSITSAFKTKSVTQTVSQPKVTVASNATVPAPEPQSVPQPQPAPKASMLRPVKYVNLTNDPLVDLHLRDLARDPERAAITHLSLIGSPVTDEGLKNLENGFNLVQLLLDNSDVTNDCVRSINTQKNLDRLSMEGTKIDDKFVEQLGPLNHLTQLQLAHTNVTSKVSEYLTNFHMLDDIGLSATKFSGEGVEGLTSSTCKKVRLIGDNLKAPDFEKLSTMTWVTCLLAGKNHVDKACVQSLSSMTNLNTLNLEGTKIDDEDIEHLKTLAQIENLNIKDCPNITDKSLESIANNFRSIKSLLLRNDKITMQGLETFNRKRPKCKLGGRLAHIMYKKEHGEKINQSE